MAHYLREQEYSFRSLGRYIDDLIVEEVQRVKEKVRVNLGLQVGILGFDQILFQFRLLLLSAELL